MSTSVRALVERRRVGSSTKKTILLLMADKASDDGSGIWIGQGTIAARLELSKRAVQKNTQALVEDGLIYPVGKKRHTNGYTVNYSIDLVAVRALPDVKASTDESNSPVNVVHPTGEAAAPHGVNDVHPNHPSSIQEPPTRVNAQEAVDSEFEKIWVAYPLDRQRGKSTCRKVFGKAMAEGIAAVVILAAVQSYARDTDGYTRSKVSFSDNWFKARRWESLSNAEPKAEGKADAAVFWANRIKAGKAVFGSPITAVLAREMIGRGLVSVGELRSAGVAT